MDRILQIKKELATLPKGSIVTKKVKGNVYYYYRTTVNGKTVDKYIDVDESKELVEQIERKKALKAELKQLKGNRKTESHSSAEYNSMVRIGEQLKNYANQVKGFNKRECFKSLAKFVFGDVRDKVFILYGLRRTGKTTMLRQLIADMSQEQFDKTAFIQVTAKDSLASINKDMKILEQQGYKYVFLDEVTLMEDFIEGAAIFSDVYASSGMKIVLSGTDSLGFMLSSNEQLYDRCILLHTTFIPYREFESVLGIKGIDEYIKYGGTMSLGGINYNENSIFANSENVNEYVDTAIAKNIQHSLKYYQDGTHFRHLIELYDKNELTSAINRVVEDINHRFTIEVLTKNFDSNDIAFSARNLRATNDILDNIDRKKFNDQLRKMLDILNKAEQTIGISEIHVAEIKEYLELLDLVFEIDRLSVPYTNVQQKVTVISQPGMRYAQAMALINSLLLDESFNDLSIAERKQVVSRILSEISGRMMEDIVLLETKLANPKKHVFKLQFAIGEFDMVVSDENTATCKIYEIKYNKQRFPEQCKFLIDEKKCADTEHRFGKIVEKCVIYRGKSGIDGDVTYLNVEEYLTSIK